ncbi:MAG TPA: hypothetical protein VFK06_20345 [Candidatus Angelobacter sp.]|nr:hypothetical protein [Candidatus Angelobacter sp.]
MSAFKSAILIACLLSVLSAHAADTVTGSVRNQTTGKPAEGDDVILLRLGQGMQEEAHTKTDAQGAFTLSISSPKDVHIVRVMHQGVTYDENVLGAAPLQMQVFDSVPKIPGVAGSMGIVQIQSKGEDLNVMEMYAIRNESTPPVTQGQQRGYEVSLPEDAGVDFVQAKTPKGIWVNIKPVARKGKKGQYSINFPLRPGETLFKIAYHLPNKGPRTFHVRLDYPIQRLAVTLPPSMSFKALRPGTFRTPVTVNGMQLEATVAEPVVGAVPAFEVSGHGVVAALPSPAPAPTASAPHVSAPPAQARSSATAAAAMPQTAHDISAGNLWLILGATVVLLAGGIYAAWQFSRKRAFAAAGSAASQPMSMIDMLKDELFQLESDRLRGAISAEEYESTKKALNQTLERSLARTAENQK